MMLHPDAERLLQFASGATPESEERRLSSHLAECDRCRRDVTATREVQGLLQLPLLPAPESLLSRVIESRATRELVFLPTGIGFPAPRPNRRRRMLAIIGAGIAATILVTMIPQSVGRFFWNGATTDVAPAPWPIDPTRVKPIKLIYDRWSYAMREGEEYQGVERLYYTIEGNRSSVNEDIRERVRLEPPWIQWRISAWDGPPKAYHSASVVIDRMSLAPLAWGHRTESIFDKVSGETEFTLHGDALRILTLNSGDKVSPSSRRDTTVTLEGRNAGRLLVSPGHLIALFMALPLDGPPPKAMRVGAMTQGRAPHLVPSDFRLEAQAIDPVHGRTVTYVRTLGNTTTHYTLRVRDGVIVLLRSHDSLHDSEGTMRLVSARFQPMN